ncbi:hypothetical protein AB0H77_17715 [Streptomyces sp. NPDC050844]|uniref:hypothetical protein n=1 Tax=Streptomyces sp. NPDC050844 TaxID=3155790 RepID=UPI0033CD3033
MDVAIDAVGRPGEDDRRTHVIDVSDIGAFLGPDVDKGEHHATAVTPAAGQAPGRDGSRGPTGLAQALLCLARRRADVFFAMLRDGTFYDPQPAPSG